MPKAAMEFIVDDAASNESLIIHDIARLMKKRFDKRARALGLTRSQWLVLGTLRRHPGIHQAELADLLDVEPMTVARLVDRLEASGWLERRMDSKDRRAKRLFLTERVQSIVSQIRDLALCARSEALAGISAEEHATLLEILKKIRNNVCSE